MLELTPDQLAAVTAQTTAPCYIMEIELDEIRTWSTRQTVVWNDAVYERGFLKLDTVTNDEARFSFYNENYTHTGNALNGTYMRKRVRIWWAYGPAGNGGVYYADPGYWKENYTVEPDSGHPEPLLRFDGIVYATPSIDNWVSVIARHTPPMRYPRPRLRPPFANHLPSPGYTVTFDNTVLTIEGRR